MKPRTYRFDCPAGGHDTGELILCGAWIAEHPRSYYGPPIERCGEPHRIMLNVGEKWLRLSDAASPGIAEDVEIGGRLLSAYRPTTEVERVQAQLDRDAPLPGPERPGCKPYRDHADRYRVGFVVRRTVEAGNQLWHWESQGAGRSGYDVSTHRTFHGAFEAAKPLRVDNNNWACVDALYACGHRD